MAHVELFNKNVADYEKWYQDYSEVYESELRAIREQLNTMPENIHGIEVGLGTGKFAAPLGIKEGVEPSTAMAEKAIKRGVEVMKGVAERLPYGDLQFDFVLFVTVCHFDSLKLALAQAYRVLKHKGSIIVGFLDKDQSVAKSYIEKRSRSTFYGKAHFYTVHRMEDMLNEAGFKDLTFNQTLFGNLDEIKEVQIPKAGFGEGSFVVVKATKK